MAVGSVHAEVPVPPALKAARRLDGSKPVPARRPELPIIVMKFIASPEGLIADRIEDKSRGDPPETARAASDAGSSEPESSASILAMSSTSTRKESNRAPP